MVIQTATVPTLSIENLAISYRTRQGLVPAVRDVSLEIRPGETFGIVGESGCGKSTVAFSIVGFLGHNGRVTNGSICFQGEDLTTYSEAELNRLRGNKIAMVYQDPMQALNPSMRLGDQLSEVLTFHARLAKDEARKRCIEMLRRVYMPDPETVMQRFPHQISGGQQQRVVIAMALLNNPALLIMDEPTTALDVTVEATVLDLVDELRREFRTSILFITHNLGVIARVADRVGVMYAGEMVESAPVERIFAHPVHPYTQGLISCLPKLGSTKESSALSPIPGRVPPPAQLPPGCAFAPRCKFAIAECSTGTVPLQETSRPSGHLVRCIRAAEVAGQHVKQTVTALPESPRSLVEHETVLRAESVKIHYPQQSSSLLSLVGLGEKKHVRAVDDVSLSLPRGCTFGIVGESGCGKSSFARAIVGLEALTDGRVDFLGVDISVPVAGRSLDLVKELQMVFQNPDSVLNPSFSIGRQIARPLRRFGTVPPGDVRDEVVRLLEAVRLNAGYYDRLPNQLSGGEKQRVGIARAFAGRPELVICDEPVSALDVSVQAAILNLLMEIQERESTTLVFISHDLSVVRYVSDFVGVMYLGQFVEIGPAEAIYAPPYHPYTESLLSAVPLPDPAVRQSRIRLEGTVPSALNPPDGCRFHTRCPRKRGELCETTVPPAQIAGEGHLIRCHIPLDELREVRPVITR